MKKKILFLGFIMFAQGTTVLATENAVMSNNFLGQSCGLSDNRLCDALTNELLKDLLKKTVYTVGTEALNKYMNKGASASTITSTPFVAAPVIYAPAATVPVSAATTVVAPEVTANTSITQTASQEEQMIIVN